MTDGIVAALVAFQANLPKIGKSSSANIKPGFAYSYADLADVSAVVLPALAAVGIAYTAPLEERNGGYVLAAKLLHTSGESIDSAWPVQPGPPQQMGSAITYGRRYCLLTMTGVHPAGEDDDAAAAHAQLVKDTVDTGGKKATRAKTAKPAPGEEDPWATAAPAQASDTNITKEQLGAVWTLLSLLGVTEREPALELIGVILGRPVDSTKTMSRAEAGAVIDTLQDITKQDDPQTAVAALTHAGEIPGQTVLEPEPPL